MSIWLSSLGFSSEEGDTDLLRLILALTFSGVSVNEPCVCLGGRARLIIRHVVTRQRSDRQNIAQWNALVRRDSDPCYVPYVIAIRNVLARRTKGAKGERRVAAPSPETVIEFLMAACASAAGWISSWWRRWTYTCRLPRSINFVLLCPLRAAS